MVSVRSNRDRLAKKHACNKHIMKGKPPKGMGRGRRFCRQCSEPPLLWMVSTHQPPTSPYPTASKAMALTRLRLGQPDSEAAASEPGKSCQEEQPPTTTQTGKGPDAQNPERVTHPSSVTHEGWGGSYSSIPPPDLKVCRGDKATST